MASRSEGPWGTLIELVPRLAEGLRRTGCRRVRLVVDGEVVYWGLLVPGEELGVWLEDTLRRFEQGWPQAKTVEVLGVWPERTERLVRVFPRKSHADPAQG